MKITAISKKLNLFAYLFYLDFALKIMNFLFIYVYFPLTCICCYYYFHYFLQLEQEIEKLNGNRGLRNRDDTLKLARLMVRADDSSTRHQLLDIILVGCIQYFMNSNLYFSFIFIFFVKMLQKNDKCNITY